MGRISYHDKLETKFVAEGSQEDNRGGCNRFEG